MKLYSKKINIRRTNNGYVVTLDWGLSGEKPQVFSYNEISEFGYDGDPEKEIFTRIFWDIIEFFNVQGSKHDKRRLNVSY